MPHAPASVGREAKGLLRQQGFKSPSCLIGSIIAYNSPLIYQSMKLKYIQVLSTSKSVKKVQNVSRILVLWVLLCSHNLIYLDMVGIFKQNSYILFSEINGNLEMGIKDCRFRFEFCISVFRICKLSRRVRGQQKSSQRLPRQLTPSSTQGVMYRILYFRVLSRFVFLISGLY